MQIYQLRSLIDIERFQRINVLATRPEDVAAPAEQLQVANNLGFFKQCIKRFALIEFINQDECCFLTIRNGSFEVCDVALLKLNLADDSLREMLAQLAPHLLSESSPR
jgi:hypothetical protein